MAFFLTNLAKSDLKDIARYTQKNFGVKQRNIYLSRLDQAFHALYEQPRIGSSCDYIRLGYFQFHVGRHLIFYRMVEQKDIEIVRVLHERMDVELHFSN